MSSTDFIDPEVTSLRADLAGTLDRMQQGIDRLNARLPNRIDSGAALTFRVDADLEVRLMRFMRAAGITNQAGALRYLLCTGLTREETRMACKARAG